MVIGDEISTECLNLFATACLIALPLYCWIAYSFFGARPCIYDGCMVSLQEKFVYFGKVCVARNGV